MYCGYCGKQLADEDRFCTQCGKPVASRNPSSAQPTAPQAPVYPRPAAPQVPAQPVYPRPAAPQAPVQTPQIPTWPNTAVNRKTLVELVASSQSALADHMRLLPSVSANPALRGGWEKSAAVKTSTLLVYLACLKRADNPQMHNYGTLLAPEPMSVQELRAYFLEALTVAQQSITAETQMRNPQQYTRCLEQQTALLDAIRKIDGGVAPMRIIACPHCHKWTDGNFSHCVHCNQPSVASAAQPMPQPVPRPVPQPAPRPVPQPAPQPAPRPVQQPAPQPAPQPTGAAQVRYVDESVKKWELFPGENILWSSDEVPMLQPAGGKFVYSMKVTERRILLSREKLGASVASRAAFAGGLLGALVVEGVKAATGAGPKPWLEIPLTAIVACGQQNKKEYFIQADQVYVFRNQRFEKFLPALVAQAKQ